MTQNMNEMIERAKTLVEALPYISAFSGKTIVIKYGGNAMNDENTVRTIMQDVAALKIVGVKPILVHGGGPEINSMLSRVHIEPQFSGGLRVTDEKTMEIVQMVLAGKINKNVVSLLNTLGVKAVGLCGKDAGLIKVKKYSPNGTDIGYVGEIVSINEKLLEALTGDYIPVISSIGADEAGVSYNVNADTAAGAIGGAVGAEKLIFLTDIDGIRSKENDPTTLISRISVGEIEDMIESGAIKGGMIPKVRGCIDAIRHGIKSVQIVNGTIPHSILLELFTDSGVGTMVTA
ncbi:MAG: acetylglutamate kinase [Clostridia bacterium]|nr:acetylglutamate kinase [Clostridia bacterium]